MYVSSVRFPLTGVQRSRLNSARTRTSARSAPCERTISRAMRAVRSSTRDGPSLRASTSSVADSSSSEKRDMCRPALSGARSATIVNSPRNERSSPATRVRIACFTDETPTRLSESRTSGSSSCRFAAKCIERDLRTIPSRGAAAASSAIVLPVRGSTRFGAISASGIRLNARAARYGCGTSKRPKFATSSSTSRMSTSIGRASSGVRVCRPIAVSIPRTNVSNAAGGSSVVSFAARLRNAGPATPFAGGVS